MRQARELLQSEDAERRLATIRRNGLLLRLALALTLHLAVDEGVFAPDQQTYHWVAEQLANYWAGERPTPPGIIQASGPKAYYYIVASLYLVFGAWALIPKMVNAFVGTASITLVYRLVVRLSGSEAAALRAAAYTAYFPSLILWSVLNLRDGWIVLMILFVYVKALELQEAFRLPAAVQLAAALILITQLRDYIFFPLVGPMVLSLFIRRHSNVLRSAIFAMLAAAVVIYVDRSGAQRAMRPPDLVTLQEYREYTGFGGSRYEAKADISTPGRAVMFLPTGVAYFLLAPFPWQITNLRQAITLPETIFFYWLLIPMVGGVRWLIAHRLRVALMVLLVTGGLTLGYSLGQANIGTAYRYRAQVLPTYLAFAAIGLEFSRRRLPSPQRVPALAGERVRPI